MKKILLLLILACKSAFASGVYETYVFSGKLYDITSIPEGLLIRLENNTIPGTCPRNQFWMLIPQTSKVILTVTLAHWYQKKRTVDIYVEPYSGSGYCKVIQVQPK